MTNTNMFINYNEYPFPHVVVDGAISQEAAGNLSGYAHGIEEESISFKSCLLYTSPSPRDS